MVGNPGIQGSGWHAVDCAGLGGDLPGVGVVRWYLDGVDFNPELQRFRVRGWRLVSQAQPAVHVIVSQAGQLSSFLPNDCRPDVISKFQAGPVAVLPDEWCGFVLEVPGSDGFDLGFERDGRMSWLRRCSVPSPQAQADWSSQEPHPAEPALQRVLSSVERHYGPGTARLVGSSEPPDTRKGRVRIHEIELAPGQGQRTVRVVEKRDASRHELALASRLMRLPDPSFAPVLDVGAADQGETWFLAGFVEPQTNMYLDPTPHVGALVLAVRAVDRCFGDLAGNGGRPGLVERYRNAMDTLRAVDERLGEHATKALESAIPLLDSLPVVASHNDFYWNNLGLEDDGQGGARVRMFDLELLGPNFAGAEFHQFARMVMESEDFRAPFDAIARAYADAADLDGRLVRVAALAFAMIRCGMRLRSGVAPAKRSDGSPRCEEPRAYAGLARWLAAESEVVAR